MKSVIISVIIGILLIWGSAEYTGGLEQISEEMLEVNNEVMNCIKAEDFDGALRGVDDLELYIEKKRKILGSTGKHNEMDEIEMHIAELVSFLKNGVKEDSFAKCSSLEFLIEHLPKNFKLRIENIL